MAAASAAFCPCRRSRYQVLTSIPKPAIPNNPTADAANIKALTPRLSRKQSEMLSKMGTNLVALANKDHTMVTTSTAARLPPPVADNLEYQSDSNWNLLSSIRLMQIITLSCPQKSGHACPLTKHKESISSVMLRSKNTLGSYAEAGLFRKEFGILGLRYAGRIRSTLVS
jgi:hypothetical protein